MVKLASKTIFPMLVIPSLSKSGRIQPVFVVKEIALITS